MDVSMFNKLSKGVDWFTILFQKLMPVSVPVFSFLCVLHAAKNIINRINGDDYVNINSLSIGEDEMLIEDVDETPEAIPEQADTEKDDPKKMNPKRIRYGGVCPYCCGVLTRVYSKKDKLKYVHCEYCGQAIDT